MIIFRVLYVVLLCVMGQSIACAVTTPYVNPNATTLLYANEVTQEKEQGLVIAKGNVEVEHEGTMLFADTLTYNERLKRLTATGNVRLKTLEGDVIFSQFLEMSDDLKEGVLNDIYMILRDDAKLAAATAQRENASRSTFDFVVYSQCVV